VTIIAKDAEVNGTVTVEGNIRIDGTVRGDIKATEGLEVGKTGIVIGTTVQSKTAIIHGRMEAHLTAPQQVTLGAKAVLVGDLRTGKLIIEEGAVFHGMSNMMDDDGAKRREAGL
jgi:cytoskeletal protein CcmA (bactofilin family)